MDLRVRAIKLYLTNSMTLRRISALLDIGKSTIHRWVMQTSFVNRRERSQVQFQSAALKIREPVYNTTSAGVKVESYGGTSKSQLCL